MALTNKARKRDWIYNQRVTVRRADAAWRSKYVHVDTEIYELSPSNHQIYVPPLQLELTDEIKHDFSHRVAMATDRVSLVDEIPENATRLEPVYDWQLAKNIEELAVTVFDLRTMLAGLFPNEPPLADGRPDGEGNLVVNFTGSLSDNAKPEVLALIAKMSKGMKVVLDEIKPPFEPENKSDSTALQFEPIALRSDLPTFISEEEEWWFSKVGDIYSGVITPRSFDFTENAGASCLIQSSVFPAMDLRQLLIGFDTIYMEPPIDDGGPGSNVFWDSQVIDRDDLIKLIAADRVRIFHRQPEDRSDLGWLREAYEANPRGVIGRRVSAGLFASNLVEMDDDFILSDPQVQSELPELVKRIAEKLGLAENQASAHVLYPRFARRQSLNYFHREGLMGLRGFGHGRLFADDIKHLTGKDFLIEADSFGSAVHVARMFDATFVPPEDNAFTKSWHEPMRMMGDRFNFYRNFRRGISAVWATNERKKKQQSQCLLPPVPIIEFHPSANIEDVLEITKFGSSRRKGFALLSRMAELPETEREAEMQKLSIELYQSQLRQRSLGLRKQTLDLSIDAVSNASGLPIASILGGWELLNLMLDLARRSPALDTIINMLEQAISENIETNEDLSLLSKVSPVAQIKTRYPWQK